LIHDAWPDYAHKKTALFEGGFRLNAELLHQTLGCRVVVILQSVFMPHYLTVQFVDQLIHRGIKVLMGAFSEHIATLDMNIALRSLAALFLLLLFHCEQHFDIYNLVKMPHDAIQFGRHIAAQGRGNLQVMTADRQIHK
jgi:hypothetical protein